MSHGYVVACTGSAKEKPPDHVGGLMLIGFRCKSALRIPPQTNEGRNAQVYDTRSM